MRLHSTRSALLFTLALAFGLSGCASAGGGGGGGGRPEGATSTRIVRAELAEQSQLNALQAVERLRGQWLRTRAGLSGQEPVLYVDGTRRGPARELSFLRADEIERMEYMSPSDATTQYGTGHTGGAIMVFTIR